MKAWRPTLMKEVPDEGQVDVGQLRMLLGSRCSSHALPELDMSRGRCWTAKSSSDTLALNVSR